MPGEDVHQENPGSFTERQAYGIMQYQDETTFSNAFLTDYLNGVATKESQQLVDAGNKAHLLPNFDKDILGNKRINGSSVDIGAVEFTKSLSTLNRENVEAIAFNIYPNPATNQVNITIDDDLNKIEIFNQQGQKVLQLDKYGITRSIDISTLNDGIYLVVASSTSNKSYHSKFVVNH